MLCRADEVNYLSGPGKGVILIKLADEDHVLGFIASVGDRDLMRVETSRGSEQTISTTKYEVTGRGGKGRELLQRGQFTRVIPADVDTPPPPVRRRRRAWRILDGVSVTIPIPERHPTSPACSMSARVARRTKVQ